MSSIMTEADRIVDTDRVANLFMLQAIQEWGQSEEERIKAVQDLLDAAGFKATATCWPVFGAIWKTSCTGEDGKTATEWLDKLTANLERGEYNSEVRQIQVALEAQRKARGEK